MARAGLLLVAVAAAAASEANGATDATNADTGRLRWPVIFAAGEGDAVALASLLAGGADVHERSRDGETALHVSAIRGSLEAVRMLLDAGAEVDARTPTGSTIYMTPSMWATYHRCLPLTACYLPPTMCESNTLLLAPYRYSGRTVSGGWSRMASWCTVVYMARTCECTLYMACDGQLVHRSAHGSHT